MQFVFNDRRELVNTITFKNENPILNVEKIRFFKEVGLSGTFLKKEFRYSFDKIVWSNWTTLTQQNLSSIKFKDNPEFYLQVVYNREKVNTGNIQSFYLFYDSLVPPVPDPSANIIDADLLQGKDGAYYLNNENHYGPINSLVVENVGDPSAVGTFHGRLDTSLGTNIYMKSIKQGDGIIVSDSSEGNITIQTDPSTLGTSYSNPEPVVNTVGGIIQGEQFFENGKTFQETMESMFFPTLGPDYDNPYNTFNNNVNRLQEIGDSINITFTSTFDRGAINVNGVMQNVRSGNPNTYIYSSPPSGTLPASVPKNTLGDTQVESNYVIEQGNQTWRGAVAYDAGPQPYDNKGNPVDSPLPAGTTDPFKLSTIEGVYPIFATTSDINVLTPQPLVSMITGNDIVIPMVPETTGRQSFSIPETWVNNRHLIGIQTYNTFTMQWEYEGGSPAASLTTWLTTPTTHIVQGNSISYIKYEYNSTLRSAIDIRLKF